MSEKSHRFREELISMEPVSHQLELEFNKEIEKMYIEEVTGLRRFGMWSKCTFILLFGAVLTGSALFNWPIALDPFGRWLWGLAGVFSMVVALLELRSVWNKKMDLRKESKTTILFATSGMTFVAFALLAFGLYSRDMGLMVTVSPMALLILIIGILIGVKDSVTQGELNTREKLLEIEYRLAALDERLQDGKTGKN